MALGNPTSITPQSTLGGATLTLTPASATNGNKFSNDARKLIFVTTGATPTNLTVHLGKTVAGQTVTPKTYAIAANKEFVVGPFSKAEYDQESGDAGYVYYSFDADTDVQTAVLSL